MLWERLARNCGGEDLVAVIWVQLEEKRPKQDRRLGGGDCCHYHWGLSKQLLHSFSITRPPRGLNTFTSVCTLLNSDKWAVRGYGGLVIEALYHRASAAILNCCHFCESTNDARTYAETNADIDAQWHIKPFFQEYVFTLLPLKAVWCLRCDPRSPTLQSGCWWSNIITP